MSELTDSGQNVVEVYKYDAFGNLQIFDSSGVQHSSSLVNNPYTYISREYDPETGLYFYRARYYDAAAGRFITADPIKFDGGINFYPYVQNNLINYIDPDGEQLLCTEVSTILFLVTAYAIYYVVKYSCDCPKRLYTEIKVVPKVSWFPEKKPRPDPCLGPCLKCALALKQRDYLKASLHCSVCALCVGVRVILPKI